MTVQILPADNPAIRLPIAPKAAARIRFAPLQPQQARVLLPSEALQELDSLQVGDGSRIELDGPGDPLLTVDLTVDTLRRVVSRYPGTRLSLATLGIDSARLLPVLKAAGLSEVLLQVSAVDPAILEKIYAWIRPGLKTLALPEAARILIAEQRQAVVTAKELGLAVTVVATVFPEYNSHHLAEIAESMAALRADRMVLFPYRAEVGADIVLPGVDPAWLFEACRNCARHLPTEIAREEKRCAASGPIIPATLPKPTTARPNVAVASSNGSDIDLHLGQATRFLIYGPREDGLVCLRETRSAPEPGIGQRWRRLAESLGDCFAILAANAGETPRQELAGAGITVIRAEDTIEGTVDALYGGGKKGKKGRN